MSDQVTDKHTELQAVNADESEPTNRIANAHAAYEIYKRFRMNFAQLAIERMRIAGMKSGAPPFNTAELVDDGLGFVTNVNFGQMRSRINQNATAIWSMLMSVPTFVSLKGKTAAAKSSKARHEYARIIEEEFTDAMLSDPDFYLNMMLKINDMLDFGLGGSVWPDEENFQSMAFNAASLYFPEKTHVLPSRWETFFLRSEIKINEAYSHIKNDQATEEGWSTEALKNALIHKFKGKHSGNDKYGEDDWMDTERRIQNLDYAHDNPDFDSLNVIHFFQKETNGRITHGIIADDEIPANRDGSQKAERQFLFLKTGRYKKMINAISILLHTVPPGGLLRSVKGMGYALYATEDLNNRMLGQIFDGIGIVSSLIIQPQTGKDASQFEIMRMGPFTWAPAGLNVVQSSFQPPIDKAVSVLGLLKSIENSTAGVHRSNPGAAVGQQQKQPVKKLQLDAQEEARHQSNQSAFYYSQHDLHVGETLRRLMNPDYPRPDDEDEWEDHHEIQKNFWNNCLERGVPEDLMDMKHWRATATRALGMGSPREAERITSWLLGIMHLLPAEKHDNIVRDAVLVRAGSDHLERYAPDPDGVMAISKEHSHAAVENSTFLDGKEAIVASDQNHIAQADVHLAYIERYTNAFQQDPMSLDLQAVVPALKHAIEHTNVHIQYMETEKVFQSAAARYTERLQGAVAVWQTMNSQAEEILAAQTAERERRQEELEKVLSGERLLDKQIELTKIQSEHEIEMLKTQSLNLTRELKTTNAIALANEKTLADMSRKDFIALRDAERKDFEALSDERNRNAGTNGTGD